MLFEDIFHLFLINFNKKCHIIETSAIRVLGSCSVMHPKSVAVALSILALACVQRQQMLPMNTCIRGYKMYLPSKHRIWHFMSYSHCANH